MDKIVLPFLVKYDGRDAERHFLEAATFGESVVGAAKFYNAIAHYCMFGFIPQGRYRRAFGCFAQPSEEGSVDQWMFIAPLAGEYAMHGAIYNKAITFIFERVASALKDIWTRPKEIVPVVDAVTEAMLEQARIDADVKTQLIGGLIGANHELASLNAKLIDTLPRLAGATRSHGVRFVQPIGSTCSEIRQFANTSSVSTITEPDADVIRGDATMEVDPMSQFKVTRISEINVRTGHCVLDVEGIGAGVPGKITDPVLQEPGNIYTRAVHEFSGCTVDAKAVKRDGQIERLYISNAGD